MLTENNWVQSNIDDHCEKNIDFVCTLVPHEFKKKFFRVASSQTAKKIYRDVKKPLYILLSGGADSEFVVRTFHRAKVPFTPVIIDTGMNPLETKVAHLICEQLELKPVIIEKTEQNLVDFYLNNMLKHFKGRSMYSIPTIIGLEYITSVGGFGITGDSPAFDDNIQIVTIAAHEFYPDRYGYEYTGFFYYNPTMFYATIAAIKDAKTPAEFKSRAYGTVYRRKSRLNYNPRTRKIFMHIFHKTSNKSNSYLGTTKEVLEFLEKWSK